MRILVISDSHGDKFSVVQAISAQPSAQVVIHLGDGFHDLADIKYLYPDKKFVQVRGNCDFASNCPLFTLEHLCEKTIYCTHGFLENVKYTTNELAFKATEAGADIVLYGHTHTPVSDYEEGLYIFNPGSVKSGSYGIVDITPAGIVCNNMQLKFF